MRRQEGMTYFYRPFNSNDLRAIKIAILYTFIDHCHPLVKHQQTIK